jgi:translation elongation factor EF-Ts
MADLQLVRELRELCGKGLNECLTALDACNGDIKLANAWLRFNGLTVSITAKEGQTVSEAYDNWVMEAAKQWVKENETLPNL